MLTCAEAVKALLKDKRRWEVRSAGKGSKGELVRLGMDRHCLAAPPPAHPPPPQERRAGLPPLLRPRRPAADQDQADPRRRAQMAHRRFRVQQGLLRTSQCQARLYTAIARHVVLVMAALAGHLCDHRRPSQGPHRHPGTTPGQARSAAARRARQDPADHPGAQAAARRPQHPPPAPMGCHPLGRMDPPPPGPRALVPQTRQTRPRRRNLPGQLAKCGCLTRQMASPGSSEPSLPPARERWLVRPRTPVRWFRELIRDLCQLSGNGLHCEAESGALQVGRRINGRHVEFHVADDFQETDGQRHG